MNPVLMDIYGYGEYYENAYDHFVNIIAAAPFFIIPLEDQHVDKGSDLTWRCISDGEPTPSYSWYRNSEEIIIDQLPFEDRDRYR